MEPIYSQTFLLEERDTDCFGRLTPEALLYIAQTVAGRHCTQLSADWENLKSRHLFWAVIRHRVQITRLPRLGETVTVETWPMPTTRVAYPRSTIARDSQGRELFRTISLWVLMHTDSRTMILPGKSGIVVSGFIRGNELPAPPSLVPKPLGQTALRTVTFSLLDRNGHMNNTRYLDWILDLLPTEFHASHSVQDFTVCYLSEALPGQELVLHWQLSEEGVMQVDAYRQTAPDSPESQRVFSSQLRFS